MFKKTVAILLSLFERLTEATVFLFVTVPTSEDVVELFRHRFSGGLIKDCDVMTAAIVAYPP